MCGARLLERRVTVAEPGTLAITHLECPFVLSIARGGGEPGFAACDRQRRIEATADGAMHAELAAKKFEMSQRIRDLS